MTTLHRFATIQKLAPSGAPLPDRVIVVRASDETIDRVGDVLVARGCDHKSYDRNPIVLADHDPTKPIGTAAIELRADGLYARITFAPEGVSAKADEYCGLAKAGVLGAVSVGFKPIESKPLATGGDRFEKWELLEISLVSVPANANALIVQRAWRGKSASPMSADDRDDTVDDLMRCLGYVDNAVKSSDGQGDRILSEMDWAGDRIKRSADHALALRGTDISASDGDHAALADRLRKAEHARIDITYAVDALREQIAGMTAHLSAAHKHAEALGGQKAMARRQREKQISALKTRIDETDAKFDAMEARRDALYQIPTVPKAWRKFVDPEREVSCILTDETKTTNGYRFQLDSMDTGGFERQGGPVLVNHAGPVVARCLKLERRGKTIVAHLQFPQAGASAAADAAFDAVHSGKLRSASAGWLLHEERDTVATRSTLREVTLCEIGANKNAVVLSVGGRVVAPGARSMAAWNDPKSPRIPTLEEAGSTADHAFALRHFPAKWLASRYFYN